LSRAAMASMPFQPIAGLYSFGASNMGLANQPGYARSGGSEPGGSSDDNVDVAVGRLLRDSPEQQAETIRKQAGKLSQLQVTIPALWCRERGACSLGALPARPWLGPDPRS